MSFGKKIFHAKFYLTKPFARLLFLVGVVNLGYCDVFEGPF